LPISDDKKKGGADPVIPTLPEVKEHAAKAISRAAKNGIVVYSTPLSHLRITGIISLQLIIARFFMNWKWRRC
jgi:hypothetical protein